MMGFFPISHFATASDTYRARFRTGIRGSRALTKRLTPFNHSVSLFENMCIGRDLQALYARGAPQSCGLF